jgi:WG containing repeat
MLYPISVPNRETGENLAGYIDAQGREAVTSIYGATSYFHEGKASVIDATTGCSGFIDQSGALVIPFRFQGLGKFKNGLCPIGGGFINHSGDWAIEPRLGIAGYFSEGRALASLDGERLGFIDATGEFVVAPAFERARQFRDGLAPVRRDERWGYIDLDGETQIPFVFEGPQAQSFSHGVAGVQIDGRCGFIDYGGNFVVPPDYDEVQQFSEGYAGVKRNNKWGLINLEGDLVVDHLFDDLREFDQGLASAQVDGKAGFISPDGRWAIQPVFDKCYRFWGSLALVRSGKVAKYIRRNGDVVWTSEPLAGVPTPPLFSDWPTV